MMEQNSRARVMGERAILIEFEPEIREEVLEKVLFYKDVIESKTIESIVEITNTYNSLLVVYHYYIEDVYSEKIRLEKLLKEANINKIYKPYIFYFPVCYDAEYGLDLNLISGEKNLSVEEIIELHSSAVYTVYFIGFLPGFLYLGGMDEKLRMSRKNEPRLKVGKGAVGIGENQTGIYPKESPGGWQIIGNCPVSVFDKNRRPPCEISAGDKVKFYPVSKQEHCEISKEVAAGKYELKREIYAD